MRCEQQVSKNTKKWGTEGTKKNLQNITGTVYSHILSGILHIHTNAHGLTAIKSFDTSTVQTILQPLIVTISCLFHTYSSALNGTVWALPKACNLYTEGQGNHLPKSGLGVYKEGLQASSSSRGGTTNSEVWGLR